MQNQKDDEQDDQHYQEGNCQDEYSCLGAGTACI